MEKNEEIKKAKSVLCEMSEDEKLQRLAFLKERAIMEEKSLHRQWKEDGKKERNIEIAKKLKEENANMDLIIKVTGLTKEEIEKL